MTLSLFLVDSWCHKCNYRNLLLDFSDNVYRECLANGTWAKKGNYSQCQEILNEEVRACAQRVPLSINYTGV